MKQYRNKFLGLALAVLLTLSLAACGRETESSQNDADSGAVPSAGSAQQLQQQAAGADGWSDIQSGGSSAGSSSGTGAGAAIDGSGLFTDRDLSQSADLSEAVRCTVRDGADVSITAAGVYVLSGSAENATVYVEAGDDDKVQLVLDGLNVTNDSFPVIYVKNADKVFVTTAEGSENSLAVTGTFTADGSTNTDAVIFARDDLVFNGLGTLNISSTDNGISGKDDIKITGGVLNISAVDHGVEANDSIAVCGGEISVRTSAKDGLHAENEDDDTEGWIWIGGGSLDICAADDGIHAVSVIQIDSGEISVTAAEGIEATWVQINDGVITIDASDDGVNAGRKSNSYVVCVEINGGSLTINMGRGDTDGIDSNGNLIITGGTISVNAQSPFDYDGTLTHTGGTILVNGSETTEITNQFGGMGGPGGMGGGNGGWPGSTGGNGGNGGWPGGMGGGRHG